MLAGLDAAGLATGALGCPQATSRSIDAKSPSTAPATFMSPILRLSYVDALVLAVSERRHADELVTLDKELAAVRLSSPVHVTIL
jgi:hypothetical protein